MSTFAALLYVGGAMMAASYASHVASEDLRGYSPCVVNLAVLACALLWVLFPVGIVVKETIAAARNLSKGWPR